MSDKRERCIDYVQLRNNNKIIQVLEIHWNDGEYATYVNRGDKFLRAYGNDRNSNLPKELNQLQALRLLLEYT